MTKIIHIDIECSCGNRIKISNTEGIEQKNIECSDCGEIFTIKHEEMK